MQASPDGRQARAGVGEWQVAEENWDLTGAAVQNSLIHGDAVVGWGCPKKVAVDAISVSQQDLLPCGVKVKEVFSDQAIAKWGRCVGRGSGSV